MKERMRFGPGHGTDISYVFDNLGRAPDGANRSDTRGQRGRQDDERLLGKLRQDRQS